MSIYSGLIKSYWTYHISTNWLYIYQHFVLCLTFWHGNGNLLMIQQSKVTWDLKVITKIYCHPTRTRSIKSTTRLIVSRNHEMKSQLLRRNGDTFLNTYKREFCVYTLSLWQSFLKSVSLTCVQHIFIEHTCLNNIEFELEKW